MIVKKNSAPLVSVVIITYNQEDFIAQAIESVLAQKCDFNFEILIGEDHSSDRTPDICRHYAAMYPEVVRLFVNERNKGVLDNYYDTLFEARGKYIADCAGDDYWIDPEKLQRQVNVLEANPDVVLTHTNYKEYYQNQDYFKDDVYAQKGFVKPQYTSWNDIYDLVNQAHAPFVFLETALFRADIVRELYEEYTSFFRNKLYPCEDYQLIFLLLRKGRFFYESDETVVYRLNDDSVTSVLEPLKQLHFTSASFRLRTDLIRTFNLNVSDCAPYFDSRLKEILSLSIRLQNDEYAEEALGIASSMNYPLRWYHKLYKVILSSSFLSFLFCRIKGY